MYAVIFTSQLDDSASEDYAEASERMEELCAAQPGFVSIDSVRDSSGRGITVCRWDSLEAIAAWRADVEHQAAQRNGIERWYRSYETTVCEIVER